MSRASDLCDRFDYPEELATLLDDVARLAGEMLDPLAGIVLTPSISSGDFLWRATESGVEFLSDIDGFVFSDAASDSIGQFRAALVDLCVGRGGPAFEIDLSFNPIAQLSRMPETFQMVETHLAGFELLGEGLLEKFPTAFEPGASRQALLLNLWKPLGAQDADEWAQNAARLLLDIPLLATSEAGICRPGHRQRAEWFLADRSGRFGSSEILHNAVEAALAARLNPPGEAESLHGFIVPAIGDLLSRLDGKGEMPQTPDVALVERLTAWLPRRPFRRTLGELRTCLRRRTRAADDIAWLRHRKEAIGGAALWGMLQIAYANRPLQHATAGLIGLYARQAPLDPDRADFVERAGDQYRSGFFELYPTRAR